MDNKTNSGAHTKWMCKYHIVFHPKYKQKVIYNQYKKYTGHNKTVECVQRSRDYRKTFDAGSYPYAGEYSTKI